MSTFGIISSRVWKPTLHIRNHRNGYTMCGRTAPFEFSGDYRKHHICASCQRALRSKTGEGRS